MKHTLKQRYGATLDKVQARGLPPPKVERPLPVTTGYYLNGKYLGKSSDWIVMDDLAGWKNPPRDDGRRSYELSVHALTQSLIDRTEWQRLAEEAARAERMRREREVAHIASTYGGAW